MDSVFVQFLLEYGLFAIFFIIMLEYACFPLSSELVLPLSGIFAAQMEYSIISVILLSVLAGLFGSSFCYLVGRWGSVCVVEKLLKRFPKMANRCKAAYDWQKKYGKFTVMLGRVVPIFRTYISFAAGLAKQSYLVFLAFSGVGILSWNTLLLSCGYLLGENFDALLPYVKRYALCAVVIVCVLFAVGLFFKKRRAKERS